MPPLAPAAGLLVPNYGALALVALALVGVPALSVALLRGRPLGRRLGGGLLVGLALLFGAVAVVAMGESGAVGVGLLALAGALAWGGVWVLRVRGEPG